MSCNKQPGASHICDWLTHRFGITIGEKDFHLLKEAAREHGLDVSRRAATQKDLTEAFTPLIRTGLIRGPWEYESFGGEVADHLKERGHAESRMTVATLSALRIVGELDGLPESIVNRKRKDDSGYHSTAAFFTSRSGDFSATDEAKTSRNPHLLTQIWFDFSQKSRVSVGERNAICLPLSRNPHTPPFILAEIVKWVGPFKTPNGTISPFKPEQDIRAGLFTNPSTPESVKTLLAPEFTEG